MLAPPSPRSYTPEINLNPRNPHSRDLARRSSPERGFTATRITTIKRWDRTQSCPSELTVMRLSRLGHGRSKREVCYACPTSIEQGYLAIGMSLI
jgi:hypothetical protein